MALQIAIGFICLLAGVFGIELVLAKTQLVPANEIDIPAMARQAAAKRGAPFDTRDIYEVVRDARTENARSYHTLSSAYFAQDPAGSMIALDGKPVLPLGINTKADTYYCWDTGLPIKLSTDRYGFRNPDALWDEAPIDVLVLGDNYAFGACLPMDESFVGVMRARVPKTISLGVSSMGILAELGTLREYGALLKPKTVVLFFLPDDVRDVVREAENPIYKQYMDPAFRQGLPELAGRLQEPMDTLAEAYHEKTRLAFEAAGKQTKPFYKVPQIRALMKYWRYGPTRRPAPVIDIDAYMAGLARMAADVKAMDARFVFVYLPDCDDFGQGEWKQSLLDKVAALDVQIVDAEAAIEVALPRGVADARYYCPGHFNPAGAKVVGEAVLKALGALP
ncbi:MAG: hypothetical protein KGQ41_04655 [Alphaproteobacteria bacterium]|nr:hypothetical protein [Alphaproteobacteria bacterium]